MHQAADKAADKAEDKVEGQVEDNEIGVVKVFVEQMRSPDHSGGLPATDYRPSG
jgi:hypothetical protein